MRTDSRDRQAFGLPTAGLMAEISCWIDSILFTVTPTTIILSIEDE